MARLDSEIAALKPTARNWFTSSLVYTGRGEVSFGDPSGTIAGDIEICVGEDGHLDATMHVEQALADGRSLVPIEFLGLGGDRNPCEQLRVRTAEGDFIARQPIRYGYTDTDGPPRLTFTLTTGIFEVRGASCPKYWVLPLTNFVAAPRGGCRELEQHPLRIYQTPSVPIDLTDNSLAVQVAKSRDNLVVFEYAGEPAFIELLADYKERKSSLSEHNSGTRITAVMVGDRDSRPVHDHDAVEAWLPYDLLPLLGLATGSEVGCAWIEFRDAAGRLVSRLHTRYSQARYQKGRGAIREEIHHGIGALLTMAQSSPHWGASELRVAVRGLIRSFRYDSATLEELYGRTCRAFETLSQLYGFAQTDLAGCLDPADRKAVKAILVSARRQIADLASQRNASGQPDQGCALYRIAERAASTPMGTDRRFGQQVVDVTQRFGLPDADLMNTYVLGSNRPDKRSTWASVLSMYRGAVVHEGFFDVTHRYDLDDILKVTRHLQDVLLRVLLKMLGYTGTYQPVVITMTACESVDWVSSQTDASLLGFK